MLIGVLLNLYNAILSLTVTCTLIQWQWGVALGYHLSGLQPFRVIGVFRD
jgi:hypothetical protein